MQIWVERFDGLDVYVSSADNALQLQENGVYKVNSTLRNFTMTPTSKFFVTLNTTKGARYPQMRGKLIFRYYTYDTNCPTFTNWNGTHCVENLGEYCASLTEGY